MVKMADFLKQCGEQGCKNQDRTSDPHSSTTVAAVVLNVLVCLCVAASVWVLLARRSSFHREGAQRHEDAGQEDMHDEQQQQEHWRIHGANRNIMESTAGCSSLYQACLEITKDVASDRRTKEMKVEDLFKKTAEIMWSRCYKCTTQTRVENFCVCKRCEHFICWTCVNNAHRKKCPACFMESVYHYADNEKFSKTVELDTWWFTQFTIKELISSS